MEILSASYLQQVLMLTADHGLRVRLVLRHCNIRILSSVEKKHLYVFSPRKVVIDATGSRVTVIHDRIPDFGTQPSYQSEGDSR